MLYLDRYFIIFAFISVLNGSYAHFEKYIATINLEQNDEPAVSVDSDPYYLSKQDDFVNKHEVEVKVYYETFSMGCILFDQEQFGPAVAKLNQYVEFHSYPYGNAKTIIENGVIRFHCQNGPKECYGNKLHACAIDNLKNTTEALLFNSCMMGFFGSNNAAADRCAKSMGVDSNPIKACAKGERGTILLKYYGEESKKANFSYVPYILINGKENDGGNFLKDICALFAVKPPPCAELSSD